MFVVAAEAASNARAAARLGVHATVDPVNWKEVRDRIFSRIAPLHEKALAYRRENGIDVYTEPARFVAPKIVLVGSEQLTADTFVVAAGSRPKLPPIPGLSDVPYHTSTRRPVASRWTSTATSSPTRRTAPECPASGR